MFARFDLGRQHPSCVGMTPQEPAELWERGPGRRATVRRRARATECTQNCTPSPCEWSSLGAETRTGDRRVRARFCESDSHSTTPCEDRAPQLLTGGLLVRVQPEEPIPSRIHAFSDPRLASAKPAGCWSRRASFMLLLQPPFELEGQPCTQNENLEIVLTWFRTCRAENRQGQLATSREQRWLTRRL